MSKPTTYQQPKSKQKFFQFALGLLAYGADEKEKLDHITAYSQITAGKAMEAKLGREQVEALIGTATEMPPNFNIHKIDHRAWYLGKTALGYYFVDPNYCSKLHDTAWSFLHAFGPSPQVRVMTSLMEDVHKGLFEFRDFQVLCAVFAVIGDKAYAVIRRDRVRAGALGYSSGRVLFDKEGKITPAGKRILADRQDKAVPLTVSQVRTALDRLNARGFLSRLHPWQSARRTYYSRSLSHEELAERLVNQIERKLTNPAAQRQGQQLFRQKLTALLNRRSSGDAAFSPEGNRTITAGIAAEPTAEITALIPASSNSCSSNSCPPNECTPNAIAGVLQRGGWKGEAKQETKSPKTVPELMAELRASVDNPQ